MAIREGHSPVSGAGLRAGQARTSVLCSQSISHRSSSFTDAMKPAIYKVSEGPATLAKAPSSRASLSNSTVSLLPLPHLHPAGLNTNLSLCCKW